MNPDDILGVNSYTKLILGTARTKVSRSHPLSTSGEAFSATGPTKNKKGNVDYILCGIY